MTSFQEQKFIETVLKNDSSVSARFGERIFSTVAKEGTKTPYLFTTVISCEPVDAPLSARPSIWETQIQLSIVGQGKEFVAQSCDVITAVFESIEQDGKDIQVTSCIPQFSNDGAEILAVMDVQIITNK